ncbi:hypothetical protein [Providencia stuartii]|uniref:hypothetical protein n=1 Tax=Providencia stuartii TaxID=588 RepID=UPI00076B3472|nr:hypothetical protein [Providencia stuartii]AMG67791.1 hypothetical protein AL507_14970 [Providencia stuartii]
MINTESNIKFLKQPHLFFLGEFDKNLSNSLIQDIVGSETGQAKEECEQRLSNERVTIFAKKHYINMLTVGTHKLSQSNKLRIASIHGAVS